MLRTALIFFALIAALALIASATFYEGMRSGELNKRVVVPFNKFIADLGKVSSQPAATPASGVKININQGTTQQEPKITQPKPTQPVVACYRYTVTHLDGSTSNRCYSQGDYNQLVSLGYDLSSAQTFYQFHLDGARGYQDQYDRTKVSMYLDAKASEQQQAQREKDKIGSITLQMQQIEQRGY